MKIAILGISGMLGNMVLEVFAKNTNYEIVATTRNYDDVQKRFSNVEYKMLDVREASLEDIENSIKDCDYVINCIGIIKTAIDEAEPSDIQQAIEVNALFPHKLNKIIHKTKTKVIQIATDCVYDGQKGGYTETDNHNPLDVYGKTKSLGEVKSDNFINLRCSIIGFECKGKTSLLEWFLNQPQAASVKGFDNHLWNGLTTYHFAKICIGIIENNINIESVQHVVPKNVVTKAYMLETFARIFGRQDIDIQKCSTAVSIDRTIFSNNQKQNQILWQSAGYENIPDFDEMMIELNEFKKGI